MKKTVITSLIVMMVLGTGLVLAENDGVLGNGAPQAKLLGKLNIIGVKNPKSDNMDNNGGSVIFVALEGKSKINLQEAPEGEGFAVLDKNGTDNDGALFQLPPPGLDAYLVGDTEGKDTTADYSVFVRPLGKPGGWATITTCAQLVDSTFGGLLPGSFLRTLNKECEWDGALASVEQVAADILTRYKGKSSFTNVTAELLTIVFKVEVDLDGDPDTTDDIVIVYVRVPIFDDIIQGEYWEYDNHGLKLCQVRFYDVETDVSADDGTWNNE